MQHARSTLHKIYSSTAQRAAGDDSPLMVWPLVCGSKIAHRAQALLYDDGELTISVPDAAWRSQLQCLGSRYIAAMNQVSPRKVTRIRFVA